MLDKKTWSRSFELRLLLGGELELESKELLLRLNLKCDIQAQLRCEEEERLGSKGKSRNRPKLPRREPFELRDRRSLLEIGKRRKVSALVESKAASEKAIYSHSQLFIDERKEQGRVKE